MDVAVRLQQHARNGAASAPLFAAIIAPFSTLMDIPALTQPWYSRGNQDLPDFTASLVLSAVSLCFNVIANALLLFRFSTSDQWWRLATRLSIVFWLMKVVITLANILVFGRRSKAGNDILYLEGFWSAVVSLFVSSAVAFLLILHCAYGMDRGLDDGNKMVKKREAISKADVCIFGRHFMLQVTLFMFTIGLSALTFSRIEKWTYFDGIYFSVVTALTIGFGDFYPTTTPGRIILFFFCILLITQLATIINGIAKFLSERTQKITEGSRREFEKRRHERRDKENPYPGLDEEIEFLEKLKRRAEMKHQICDILVSMLVFISFWVIGAIAFWQIEGWPYGDALYFCYVFFFTIGYGDFAPSSNGGRVFFVVYALVAVPIMTSFAVQTIISTMLYFSNQRVTLRGKKMSNHHDTPVDREREFHKEFPPHGQLVLEAHKKFSTCSNANSLLRSEKIVGSSEIYQDLDKDIRRVLALTTKLEGYSRRLLVGHLCASDKFEIVLAGNLLKADWNVQRREILAVLDDNPDPEIDIDGDGKPDFEPGAESDIQLGVHAALETLEEVKKYRVVFAEFLAAASALQRLEGKRRLIYERRRSYSNSIS